MRKKWIKFIESDDEQSRGILAKKRANSNGERQRCKLKISKSPSPRDNLIWQIRFIQGFENKSIFAFISPAGLA